MEMNASPVVIEKVITLMKTFLPPKHPLFNEPIRRVDWTDGEVTCIQFAATSLRVGETKNGKVLITPNNFVWLPQ